MAPLRGRLSVGLVQPVAAAVGLGVRGMGGVRAARARCDRYRISRPADHSPANGTSDRATEGIPASPRWADTPDRARRRWAPPPASAWAEVASSRTESAGRIPQPGQVARLVAAAVEGGLLGQHMNDRGRGGVALGGGRQLSARAPLAGQVVPARAPAGRRASVRRCSNGARIVRAHRGGQRIEALRPARSPSAA